MSVIKEGFLPREKGSVIRKGRPKSEDPKVSVSLSIRRSTRARISAQLADGQTVGGALSAAVEAKYGRSDPSTEVTPRLKGTR